MTELAITAENSIIKKKLILNINNIDCNNNMNELDAPKIKTMRYLGNKTDHLDLIGTTINDYCERLNLNKTITDGFGGTGSVTKYFNNLGYTVTSNDINNYAFCLCYSRNHINKENLVFEGLSEEGLNNIDEVLTYLNKCKHKGFVYYNYSPNKEIKYERKYFTNENAEIIDGIRTTIEKWYSKEKITYDEYVHLTAILIETVSLFSNIPGTYGAFCKNWDSRALKTLQLNKNVHQYLLCESISTNNITYNENLREIINNINSDILYLDPPYNERDYGAYYHVLETIALYDNPELKDNKTGTKKKHKKSLWCKKSTVKKELEFILKNSKSKIVVLSYNNEGLIIPDEIKQIFEKYGKYNCVKKEVRRFKCNNSENDVVVYEYLHILEKSIIKQTNSVSSLIHGCDYGIIYNNCCLNGMMSLPAKSVDLICCDLPYGLTECKWDTPIDLDKLWECYNRVLKDYGTIILFGQQPFTSRLVASNYKMFKYSLVWHKSKPGGFAQAPYKVLCEHEDILVFTYGKTAKNAKHRMTYNPQGTIACNKKMKGKTGATSHRKNRKTQKDYTQTTTNYPRSILKFNNEGKVKHPTQKPQLLIEYLINTFSNEGEVVLDNCMGSGTTADACIKTNRKYIGYEKEKKYFDICIKRIEDSIASL